MNCKIDTGLHSYHTHTEWVTFDLLFDRYEREETFMALNLGVTSCQSLEISLDQFVRGEVLEGSNAYYCEKCKEKVCSSSCFLSAISPDTRWTNRVFPHTENYSEEDMHQISAQCPLHPPHALWL